MFLYPPSLTKERWVYDDPSGIDEGNRTRRPSAVGYEIGSATATPSHTCARRPR